jgi:microcystin-dependent protein
MSSLDPRDFGDNLTDAEIDDIDNAIATAIGELMENALIGVLLAVPLNATPDGMLRCDGATHNVADYPALAAYLGPDYAVSATQFTVPDYRGYVLVDKDARGVAATSGANSVTMTVANLPAHSHTYQQYTFGVDIESVGVPDPTGVGQPTFGQSTSSVGSGNPVDVENENKQVRWCIVAE